MQFSLRQLLLVFVWLSIWLGTVMWVRSLFLRPSVTTFIGVFAGIGLWYAHRLTVRWNRCRKDEKIRACILVALTIGFTAAFIRAQMYTGWKHGRRGRADAIYLESIVQQHEEFSSVSVAYRTGGPKSARGLVLSGRVASGKDLVALMEYVSSVGWDRVNWEVTVER
jgi:hypothetical protein